MYARRQLDSWYFTVPGFYLFFIPVRVPYKQIYAKADAAGLKKKEAFGPILEKGKVFGFGWIGIEIEKPSERRGDVTRVSGDFERHEHRGPYKTLGQAYRKIMKERPGAKEFYNLYLDDPEKTPPEALRTHVLFR